MEIAITFCQQISQQSYMHFTIISPKEQREGIRLTTLAGVVTEGESLHVGTCYFGLQSEGHVGIDKDGASEMLHMMIVWHFGKQNVQMHAFVTSGVLCVMSSCPGHAVIQPAVL